MQQCMLLLGHCDGTRPAMLPDTTVSFSNAMTRLHVSRQAMSFGSPQGAHSCCYELAVLSHVRRLCRWGLLPLWRQTLHTDWVTQLHYVSELNSILSCSLDTTLCLADVDRRITTKRLQARQAASWAGCQLSRLWHRSDSLASMLCLAAHALLLHLPSLTQVTGAVQPMILPAVQL